MALGSPVNTNWTPTVLHTGKTKNNLQPFPPSMENHIHIIHYRNCKGEFLHEIL